MLYPFAVIQLLHLQVTDKEVPNWILLVNANMVAAVDTVYHTVIHIQTQFNQYENCYTSTQTSAAFEVLDGEQFELVCLGEEGGERFP